MWCPWARRDWPEQQLRQPQPAALHREVECAVAALVDVARRVRLAVTHARTRTQSHTRSRAHTCTRGHPAQPPHTATHRRTCSFTMLLHCSMHMASASGTPIAPEMIAFRNGEIGRRRPSCWYCIPLRCRRLARRTAERHAARSQNTRASSWERKSLACCAQTNNDHGAIDSTWTQHDVSGRRSRRGTPRTHGAAGAAA